MGLIWITPHKRSAVRGYNASILQNPAVGSTFKTFFNLGVQYGSQEKADKTIVMDAGKIVEVGKHKQLLKIENGFYRNLYEVQFMKEEAI